MGWIASNWKLILLVILVAIVGYAVLQYSECRKAGKAAGKPFKCEMFKSKPVSILPVDEYYDIREGECYHYLDYGDRMSVRKVGIEKCN